MTAIYTEDILRALNKTQLIELFLKSQEHIEGIINSLTEEMKNLLKRALINSRKFCANRSVERQCWKIT